MDKPDNVISLINLATVRSLEEHWGIKIDPLRFRANLYIDGVRALGRIRLGGRRHPDRRGAVSRRPAQRPVRRHQRQSRNRPARPRPARFAARRLRTQGTRNLPCRQGRRVPERGRSVLTPTPLGTASRATARAITARGSPAVHVRRMLFYLRDRQLEFPTSRSPQARRSRRFRRLAMSGLRHRKNDVSAPCRAGSSPSRGKRLISRNETDLNPIGRGRKQASVATAFATAATGPWPALRGIKLLFSSGMAVLTRLGPAALGSSVGLGVGVTGAPTAFAAAAVVA